MATETLTAPGGIRFEVGAIYSQQAVASAFGVSTRSVERWRRAKRNRLSAPFYVGNVPHWKGETLNRWFDRKAEAAE